MLLAMLTSLRRRVAVVTGAASGIGLAMARRFAQEGMRLALADIDAAALPAVADELRSQGTEVVDQEVDVADEASWRPLPGRCSRGGSRPISSATTPV